jgi:regulatory protein
MTNKALKYFFNILKVRDYSEFQLRQKAVQKEYLATEIDEAINYLKTKNYLNDLRLAENFIHNQKGKKGKNWIVQKLAQKGVSKEILNNLSDLLLDLNSFDNSYLQKKLESKYKIKFTDWQNIDYKIKQKIMAFLYRQGFSDINKIIQNWQE